MNRNRNRSLVAPLIGLLAAAGVTIAANQVSAGEGPAARPQHVLSPAGDVTALPYSWHLGDADDTHHTAPQHVWSGG